MTSISTGPPNSLNLVLAGEAGQGLQVIEGLLTRLFRTAGYHVFAGHEFMSRIRGGSNSTLLRVSTTPVRAWSSRTDLCVILDEKALAHLGDRLQPHTIILGDNLQGPAGRPVVDVPLAKSAAAAGGRILISTIAVGVLWGLFNDHTNTLENTIKWFFKNKTDAIIDKNIVAAQNGADLGQQLQRSGQVSLKLPPPDQTHPRLQQQHHLTGTEAFALGAMAGGCNFVAAYPMSPSTGVLSFMARHGPDLGIIVEQAEDEIAAANMVLGAWYAGGRGLATTSGGGFALMTEAVSLAGMIETPMVVLLAQRPGPATGLPTRTEQADFNLALYAGHGEFPRVLLAPGNPEQAFALAHHAFEVADQAQVPVIVLTDQYLMDSGFDVAELNIPKTPPQAAIVQTTASYKRYAITASGLSPRGIPGWGDGLVMVDSDEHDESGHITEDLDLRVQMVDKRLRKQTVLLQKALPPTPYGSEEARTLIVCWGATLDIVREALAAVADNLVAMLHFQQVFPLSEKAPELLRRARTRILVESNATGQFGNYLQQHWGIVWQHRLLKYNGLAFAVEELTTALQTILSHKDLK